MATASRIRLSQGAQDPRRRFAIRSLIGLTGEGIAGSEHHGSAPRPAAGSKDDLAPLDLCSSQIFRVAFLMQRDGDSGADYTCTALIPDSTKVLTFVISSLSDVPRGV